MHEDTICHKKVLFIAKVAKGHILSFHIPYLKMLKEMGCEVHVATGDEAEVPYCDVKYTVPLKGSPVSIDNIKAYKELKKIIEKERYDLVHTHTSMGGAIGRLAARKSRKHGTIVMHTAHGFAFYKGAPVLSWLLYYPIEKICSCFTDCLLTMNTEDFNMSVNRLKAKENIFVNGVGVDLDCINNKTVKRDQKRAELWINNETPVLISVGELNKNKNHIVVIRAIRRILDSGTCNLKYYICGEGPLQDFLKLQIRKLDLENNVHLLGHRTDVNELLKCSDIFIMPSFHEGLPRAVMEAMAVGLPVVCSNIRGNVDLLCDMEGGMLLHPKDIDSFARYIKELIFNQDLRVRMGNVNIINVQQYDINNVIEKMNCIYKSKLL